MLAAWITAMTDRVIPVAVRGDLMHLRLPAWTAKRATDWRLLRGLRHSLSIADPQVSQHAQFVTRLNVLRHRPGWKGFGDMKQCTRRLQLVSPWVASRLQVDLHQLRLQLGTQTHATSAVISTGRTRAIKPSMMAASTGKPSSRRWRVAEVDTSPFNTATPTTATTQARSIPAPATRTGPFASTTPSCRIVIRKQ